MKLKHIKTFENYGNYENELINMDHEYLEEDFWEDIAPEKIKLKKDKHTATFENYEKTKNLNSVILKYRLKEASTSKIPEYLRLNISFKEKSISIDRPLEVTFEIVVEATLGNLYIMGIKAFDEGDVVNYIERKGEFDAASIKKLEELIKYITGRKIKLN